MITNIPSSTGDDALDLDFVSIGREIGPPGWVNIAFNIQRRGLQWAPPASSAAHRWRRCEETGGRNQSTEFHSVTEGVCSSWRNLKVVVFVTYLWLNRSDVHYSIRRSFISKKTTKNKYYRYNLVRDLFYPVINLLQGVSRARFQLQTKPRSPDKATSSRIHHCAIDTAADSVVHDVFLKRIIEEHIVFVRKYTVSNDLRQRPSHT